MRLSGYKKYKGNYRREMGMLNCKWCDQPFLPVKDWQVYCSERCQQDWPLHQRRLARQEKLFAKLRRRDEAVAKLNNGQLAQLVQDSRGTAEEREKAKEVLAQLIRRNRPKLVR